MNADRFLNVRHIQKLKKKILEQQGQSKKKKRTSEPEVSKI